MKRRTKPCPSEERLDPLRANASLCAAWQPCFERALCVRRIGWKCVAQAGALASRLAGLGFEEPAGMGIFYREQAKVVRLREQQSRKRADLGSIGFSRRSLEISRRRSQGQFVRQFLAFFGPRPGKTPIAVTGPRLRSGGARAIPAEPGGFHQVIFICHTPLVWELADRILSVGDGGDSGDVVTDFPHQ
jgi:hypothetical protein